MLTLVAGTDECGFGPILGPLVVASSIFLVRENPKDDMWVRLQESIGKSRKGLRNRILVCDSKKAYSRQSGLGHLEQTVRAFLNQLHLESVPFSSILPLISNDIITQAKKYPWYSQLYDDCIPEIGQSTSNTLMENMKREGIEFVDFRCCCIDVAEFNRIVGDTGNKATAVTSSVLKLIRQIIALAIFCNAKKIVIYCDRLGGRKYYGDMLGILPGFKINGSDESNWLSKYKLISSKQELDIQFEVGADNLHFPVALASMVGKYIREKVMQHMNEYFIKLQPGLKPTAGYWTDGWRFLKDLEDETYEKSGLHIHDILRIK